MECLREISILFFPKPVGYSGNLVKWIQEGQIFKIDNKFISSTLTQREVYIYKRNIPFCQTKSSSAVSIEVGPNFGLPINDNYLLTN